MNIWQIIFWGSFAVFPFLILVVWWLVRTDSLTQKVIAGILIAGSLLFIWMRFVEPQLITVHEHEIDAGFSTKIALIADPHVGVFKDADFIKRVVTKINEQNPDLVLIAGDLVYKPDADGIAALLAPLSELDAPAWAVLGNHDHTNHEGDITPAQISENAAIRAATKSALQNHGVTVLENEAVAMGDWQLLGLNDLWEDPTAAQMLKNFSPEENVLVLTHNPDSTLLYPNDSADVTLCGHTHGGQIKIPIWYKHVIPTFGDFDEGYSEQPQTKLFITSGLGETGLPMRLFNPPTIDILQLR